VQAAFNVVLFSLLVTFLPTAAAYTRLSKNGLEGSMPTELGKLTLLRELWLWENGIEGQIPSELGLMIDMGKRNSLRSWTIVCSMMLTFV